MLLHPVAAHKVSFIDCSYFSNLQGLFASFLYYFCGLTVCLIISHFWFEAMNLTLIISVSGNSAQISMKVNLLLRKDKDKIKCISMVTGQWHLSIYT